LVTIATEERAALAAALHAAGPDAPTLCEGWTTHDLAAHLWFRENDPRAMLGIVVPSLAESQLERVKQERPYSELVDAFAAGPTRLSPFAIAKVDEVANAPEFFVHHEDVRRGDGAVRPRTLGDDVQAWAWPVATTLAGGRLRKAPVSVVLERRPGGQQRRYGRGDRVVTVVGLPTELLLLAFGRTRAAELDWVGDPDSVAALKDFLKA
jgi:uncharacterized protein (TIGR03085 family)